MDFYSNKKCYKDHTLFFLSVVMVKGYLILLHISVYTELLPK